MDDEVVRFAERLGEDFGIRIRAANIGGGCYRIDVNGHEDWQPLMPSLATERAFTFLEGVMTGARLAQL